MSTATASIRVTKKQKIRILNKTFWSISYFESCVSTAREKEGEDITLWQSVTTMATVFHRSARHA
jgi:hypothetical protein